jgi:hypothetical protein
MSAKVRSSTGAEGAGDNICAYLTESERNQLLANLHRVLTWVGVQVPTEIKVDKSTIEKELERDDVSEADLPPEVHLNKGSIDLRNLIWRLINEKELSHKEREEVKGLIDILQGEERHDEQLLKEENLTKDQARKLFDETSSIIRALLDLKELLSEKDRTDGTEKLIRSKVESAKRWNEFVKRINE